MIKDEKRFNKIVSSLIMAGMLIAIGITTAFKMQDPGARHVMLLIAAFGSLFGVLCTVLSANGLIWTFLFGILDVVLDSVVAFDTGVMGNFALHAFYFLPMQFVGLWQWRKRGASAKEEVKARRLTWKGWALVVASIVAGVAVSYFVLYKIDLVKLGDAGLINRPKVFLDATVLTLNIVGQVLMSLAYFEQWIIWNFVNIFSILLWGNTMLSSEASSYTVVMFIKYIFYLLNSINGLRIWYSLSRE